MASPSNSPRGYEEEWMSFLNDLPLSPGIGNYGAQADALGTGSTPSAIGLQSIDGDQSYETLLRLIEMACPCHFPWEPGQPPSTQGFASTLHNQQAFDDYMEQVIKGFGNALNTINPADLQSPPVGFHGVTYGKSQSPQIATSLVPKLDRPILCKRSMSQELLADLRSPDEAVTIGEGHSSPLAVAEDSRRTVSLQDNRMSLPGTHLQEDIRMEAIS
ncbi:hypothetical protein FRC08_005966 [Ceratobasidium sp. 394]|nr:hypothetical protein FRC08_005966 [Ceratobasidium sp. 394]